MLTFGEKAALQIESINWFGRNTGLQDVGRKHIPSIFRSNIFELDKLYFLNVEKTGVFAPRETDKALTDLQTYCTNIENAKKILEPYTFKGLPTNYETSFGKITLTDKNALRNEPKEHLDKIESNIIKWKNLKSRSNSFGEREAIRKALLQLKNDKANFKNTMAFLKKYKTFKDPLPGASNNIFTKDCEIYEYQIPTFLGRISDIAQEVNRRGYGEGFSVDTIFTGYVGFGYMRGKERLRSSDMPGSNTPQWEVGGITVDTKTEVSIPNAKKIHNTIMTMLFLKPRKLLYLTHDEYENIKKAGIVPQVLKGIGTGIGKGALGLGREIMSAGASQPSIRQG